MCVCVLEFGNEFRKWRYILIKNPKSCVTNGGNATPYSKSEKGIRQGDPISVYLYCSFLYSFFFNSNNSDIESLQFFIHTFLLSTIFKKRDVSSWSNKNVWYVFSCFFFSKSIMQSMKFLVLVSKRGLG